MKIIEKILSFLDNYHKEIFYIIIALTIFSEVMFNFYHTPTFGYTHATTEENLNSTLLTVILFLPIIGFRKYYTDVFKKRDITLFYIILLISAIFQVFTDFYCIFIEDIPMVMFFSFYIPLFIALAIWIYRIRFLFKGAINNIISNIKLYINLHKK